VPSSAVGDPVDAIANAVETGELLDVDVHEFTRPRVFVLWRHPRRLEMAQPCEPEALEHLDHRRDRKPENARDLPAKKASLARSCSILRSVDRTTRVGKLAAIERWSSRPSLSSNRRSHL